MYDGGAAFVADPPSPEPNVELGPDGPVSAPGSAAAALESRFAPGAPNDELAPGLFSASGLVAGFVGMNGSALLGVDGVVPGVAEPGVPESGFAGSPGVGASPGFPGVIGLSVPAPGLPAAPVPELPAEDVPVPDGDVPDAPVLEFDDPVPPVELAPVPLPLDPAAPAPEVAFCANAIPLKHTPARQSVIHCRSEIMARRNGRLGMDGRAQAGTEVIALPDAHEPRNCLISARGGQRVKGIEPS